MLVVVPVTPPGPAGRANGDQSAIFRTLANPLRRRILSHLEQHQEANSTSLAQALGESTGTTSYHLRKLAEQGFVAEIPEKSGGRERWWRALPFHIQAPDPAKMAAAELSAAMEQTRAKAEHDIDLYFRVLAQYEGPEGWAQSSRGGFYMTKQELLGFFKEYIALQWKYGHTAQDAPAGARPVALRFFAVPDDTALGGNGGELPFPSAGAHPRALAGPPPGIAAGVMRNHAPVRDELLLHSERRRGDLFPQARPASRATIATCTRFAAPSLVSTRDRCALTVASLMYRRAAMSALE
jgi:DNA-binding transcriptional ArsR family regulator